MKWFDHCHKVLSFCIFDICLMSGVFTRVMMSSTASQKHPTDVASDILRVTCCQNSPTFPLLCWMVLFNIWVSLIITWFNSLVVEHWTCDLDVADTSLIHCAEVSTCVVIVVVAVVDLYSASHSASNALIVPLCRKKMSFQRQSEAVLSLSRVPEWVWKRVPLHRTRNRESPTTKHAVTVSWNHQLMTVGLSKALEAMLWSYWLWRLCLYLVMLYSAALPPKWPILCRVGR